jgi:hypothetical protein
MGYGGNSDSVATATGRWRRQRSIVCNGDDDDRSFVTAMTMIDQSIATAIAMALGQGQWGNSSDRQ